MQLLTGNNGSASLNEKPPTPKKRRTNSSKRSVINQLSAPMSLSASPQPAVTFNSISSFTENLLPLDMSRKTPPNNNNTNNNVRITSPTATIASNAVSVVQSPKRTQTPDDENDDIVVDVCGTECEKPIKKEVTTISPKLPKAESPDYERMIANGYKFGIRPEFMPLMGTAFNPFFLVGYLLSICVT